MKANDYAKLFLEAEDKNESIAEIGGMFFSELTMTMKQRKCQSDSACIAVFKEIDQKWRVFAKLTKTNPAGFQLISKTLMPDFFTSLEKTIGETK